MPARRFSFGPGGSLTSDTESSDEPTQDAPSSSSDFGLDKILGRVFFTVFLQQFFCKGYKHFLITYQDKQMLAKTDRHSYFL